jgi:hypothetical protein
VPDFLVFPLMPLYTAISYSVFRGKVKPTPGIIKTEGTHNDRTSTVTLHVPYVVPLSTGIALAVGSILLA